MHFDQLFRISRLATLVGLVFFGCTSASYSRQSASAASDYSVLHTFNAYADGFSPYFEQLLLGVDGNFYGTTRYGGTNNSGTVFKLTPAGELTTLFSFTANSIGQNPQGLLAQDSSGTIYGTTEYGGAAGDGVVYEIRPDGSGFKTLYSFAGGTADGANPATGVVLSGSILYGVLLNDGADSDGAIYSFATSGAADTLLHSFNAATDGDDAYFAPILSGSTLYGCCSTSGPGGGGTLYSQTIDGATFSVLYAFSTSANAYGYNENDVVRGLNGVLYGNSSSGGSDSNGAIWSYKIASHKMGSVYSFTNGRDGNTPSGYLQVSGMTLYGTTNGGGTDVDNDPALGVVYSLNIRSKVETTLHAFRNDGSEGSGEDPGVLFDANISTLLGIRNAGSEDSYGDVWSVDTSGKVFDALFDFGLGVHDGSTPYAALFEGPDNRLYGTTYYGYNSGPGTVYSIGLVDAGYSIDCTADGNIYAPVSISNNSDIVGVTYNGGGDKDGSLFSILDGGYDVLLSFSSKTGSMTNAPLFSTEAGSLFFSTAESGGQYGYGAIYRYNPANNEEAMLYSFTGGADGATPTGGVIQASDGYLYGTTSAGGSGSDGTIFKFNTKTHTLTTLHSFTGADGANPYAGVIEGANGLLYGTTYNGGANGEGVLYSIGTTGAQYKPLHTFGSKPGSADGANPMAGVVQFANGRLYGTTWGGGAYDYGVVYDIQPSGGAFTDLHSFANDDTDGINPASAPTEGSDGNIYGECVNNGISPYPNTNIGGTIWEIATEYPEVNSITPASGPIGTTVTIYGVNLTGATGVEFNGTPATTFNVVAPTKITATVPTGSTTGVITITMPSSTVTSKVVFTVG